MYISQQLRKKNIAEYLLYMWQIEDLIRAYDCSLARIRREYISQFDYSDEQKDEMTDWYGNLIRMMNEEGKREKGHLQINEIILQDLIEVCLNALYGVMLLRLQHKEITPETAHAIEEITTFIGMLSDYYIKDKNQGIQFEEE